MTTITDPKQRKSQLHEYFDGIGFERWAAIYGEAKLSSVRKTVRDGHNVMLSNVQAWLAEHRLAPGATILDAGCGTGLFSLAMAKLGYRVTAVDIAPRMLKLGVQQAEKLGLRERINFIAGDLEVVSGKYDAVVCLDVLIHYPSSIFAPLCTRLASLSRGPLFITYAPYNALLAAMHWAGGHFPQTQRRTDIQMIKADFVQETLKAARMRVRRSIHVGCGFYQVNLLEANLIS